MAEETKAKRKYVKREKEFFPYTCEQLLGMIKTTSDELKGLAVTPENVEARKELNNKRVRIYARLRKLGYSAQAMRSKKKVEPVVEAPKVEVKEEVKEEVKQVEPPAPVANA